MLVTPMSPAQPGMAQNSRSETARLVNKYDDPYSYDTLMLFDTLISSLFLTVARMERGKLKDNHGKAAVPNFEVHAKASLFPAIAWFSISRGNGGVQTTHQ